MNYIMKPTETELKILAQLDRIEARLIELQDSIGGMPIIKTRAGEDDRRLYTIAETAIFLKIPKQEVQKLMFNGTIPFDRGPARSYRFWAKDVREAYDKHLGK
jgi:hypothetical protein